MPRATQAQSKQQNSEATSGFRSAGELIGESLPLPGSMAGRPTNHRRDGRRGRYQTAPARTAPLPDPLIAGDIFRCRITPAINFRGDCWLLRGRANSGGYVQIGIGSRRHLAHRLAFHAFTRPLRPGELVLHRCDARRCVNPAHLVAGTAEENALDMARKGRAGRARISEETARAILMAAGSLSSIAREFGVSKSQAGAIRQRRSWRHL